MAPCVTAGDGGGMLGGVDRDCVFTSAGESGMAAAFFSGLPAWWRERKRLGWEDGGMRPEEEGSEGSPLPWWLERGLSLRWSG